MRILDRYLAKKCIFALICILCACITVVLFFDLLLNLDNLLSAKIHGDHSRWVLMSQLYLMRIPTIINSLLPYTLTAAALVTCAPMLRKNEFTALGASGFGPQQICRVLLWIALACGIIQYGISNHIKPLMYNHNSHVETALGNGGYSSRCWKCTDNNSIWFAANSRIFNDQAPSFDRVFIVADNGDIVYATGMAWYENEWQLQSPIIHWKNNTDEQSVHQLTSLELSGPLALSYSPYDIQQELLTREALTGGALFASGLHMHLSLVLNRCLGLFVPLLALCYALPFFARFANRQRILVASSKALALAAVPVLIIALSGMAADASSWSPWISNGLGLMLAALPGIFLYRRWQY